MKKKAKGIVFQNPSSEIHYHEDFLLVFSDGGLTVYTSNRKIKAQVLKALKVNTKEVKP